MQVTVDVNDGALKEFSPPYLVLTSPNLPFLFGLNSVFQIQVFFKYLLMHPRAGWKL
jgi:hypothetical protein